MQRICVTRLRDTLRPSFALAPRRPERATREADGGIKMRVLWSSLLLATLLVAAPAAVRALDAADLPRAVQSAKTPADHEAIAAYFDEQAKAARAEAAHHRDLAAIYGKEPPVSPKGGETHAFHRQMAQHCDALAKEYEQAAKDYASMAAAHRAKAKAAAR
jgi:hypothetical protein